MQMTIDCPECGTPLLVPETAAGRKARCTSCSAKFVIPSAEDMLDMTVSHLVLDEMDHRRKERAYDQPDPPEEPNQAVASPAPPTPDPTAGGTIVGVPAVSESASHSSQILTFDEIHADDSAAGMPAISNPTATAPPSADSAYPTELIPSEPRPYLVVRDLSVNGVLIRFHARWLRHEVFRTSMPIRCAFSGANDKALSARPMVFANRVEAGEEQARSIELRYEHEKVGKRTPRELAREIGRMNEMTPPYDNPLLYYVVAGRATDAMECRVVPGPDGDDACEVLVPSGPVAVEWIARVNGRCGPEYALLKSEVANLSSDAWTLLPAKVRARLEPWCKFQSGEKFLLYLNDADFSSADAGLGGVVVTDQRVIYHKYRRLRSLSLNQNAVLHVRPDDRVARLTLESAGRLARMGKIQRSDMNQLVDALSTAPRLRVMVGGS